MTTQEGPTQKHSSKVNIKMKTQKVFRDIKQKELEKLLLEGKNISEIARYFNVGRATVRDRIERFNLEDARETGKIDTEKELKMCILFLQLNGVKKIAKIMHTSPKKVKIVLSKYGLQVLEAGKWTKVVDHIKEKNFDLSISDYLTQVIIGHILGDASLRIMKKGDLSYPDLDFGEYSIYGDYLKSLQFTDITEITDDLVGIFNKATKFISDYPTAIFRFSQGTIENWFKEEWVDFNSSLFNKEF